MSALVTLALVSNGDATRHNHRRVVTARPATHGPSGRGRSAPHGAPATHGPMAAIPAARPAPMIATPGSLLELCRKNNLLRPLCPARVPAWGSGWLATPGFYCQTRNPHQTARQTRIAFGSKRCLYAEWDFTGSQSLAGWTPTARVRGWDGRHWVADEFSMFSPPLHVGVQIEASRGSFPDLALGPVSWPEGAHAVSDSLLGPARASAVSLGWVHWHGYNGQLVLTPWGPCEAGTELILYLPPDARGVSYAVTLDAWMSALRLGGKATDRVFRFQRGPALPHVIATLKAIVSATLTPRGTPENHR